MTRVDRLLLVVVYLGLAATLAWAHHVRIDRPRADAKAALHEATLRNEAPDPYQYKLAMISHAVEVVRRATGARLSTLFAINTFLSLAALVFAHHAWLARLYGRRDAVVGTLLLAALAHVLFLDYYHHPHEFWGLAGFCLLLRAVAAEKGFATLAALGLATGLVFEKHALVPLLAGARRAKRGEPLLRTALGTALAFAAAVAVPVAIRLLWGTHRPEVDDTGLSGQRWDWVAAHHAPYLLPPLLVAAVAWRRLPDWVRWLWWYVPALFLSYLASRYIVHELRSFWPWAPVFTATVAGWVHAWDDVPAPERPARP